MAEEFLKVDKVPLSEQLHTGGGSVFAKYKIKTVGDVSFFRFCLYECFCLLLANLGGALGYVLRKTVAKFLFKSAGPGLILGRGLVLRHPGRVSFGANVAVDDYVFIEACGSGETGVQIHDGVVLSRNCIVLGKNGPIILEEDST